jgi:hypothetical protein
VDATVFPATERLLREVPYEQRKEVLLGRFTDFPTRRGRPDAHDNTVYSLRAYIANYTQSRRDMVDACVGGQPKECRHMSLEEQLHYKYLMVRRGACTCRGVRDSTSHISLYTIFPFICILHFDTLF